MVGLIMALMCERPYRVKPRRLRTKPSPVGLQSPLGNWNRHRSPKDRLREFFSPGPGPIMLSTVDVDKRGDEEEKCEVQVLARRDLFARWRRELGSQVVEVTGRVSRGDGTVNVIATDLHAVPSGVSLPPSHN